jgi:DNA-binding MarR family transcriptional regulator
VVAKNHMLDLESRAGENDHEDLRLWLRLLSCTNLLEASLRRQLARDFATTLPRFDLLAQLERSPGGLKMGELSRRLMVTGGNVTAITDMLEKEELVERRIDPHDRRSNRVRITRKGLAQFRRMAARHEEWIVEQFSQLSDRQKQQLSTILHELKLHLRSTEAEERGR